MKDIKLGIIGAGKITTNAGRHIDSIKALKDSGVEITAIADIVPGLAKSVAKQFGIPNYFEDYRELLKMEEINAITINTSTSTHKKIAIDVLNSSKHLYVEKPISSNAEELEEIIKVTESSGKIFLGGSNGLLQSQMGVFKNLIDKGDLGEVYMISVDRASSRDLDYGKQKTQKIGEGISSHSGSHNVEWALYFLGDPKPVSVIAKGYYKYNNLSISQDKRNEDDDCCLAIVQFDNGSSFHFKAFRAAPVKDMYELKIYGDKMSIEYDVHNCYKKKSDDCIRFYRYDKTVGMQSIDPMLKCGKTHEDMYRHFFDCIRNNKKSISNGERGLVVMKILDAMRESIANEGKQVFI
jgi:Predicted dehydrogenases and related proteins